jgi:hypothetical protein
VNDLFRNGVDRVQQLVSVVTLVLRLLLLLLLRLEIVVYRLELRLPVPLVIPLVIALVIPLVIRIAVSSVIRIPLGILRICRIVTHDLDLGPGVSRYPGNAGIPGPDEGMMIKVRPGQLASETVFGFTVRISGAPGFLSKGSAYYGDCQERGRNG